MIRVLLIILLLCSNALAVDTVVCGDDDDSGTQSKLKSSGLPDRDCDGELSVSDGGPDCDDTNILIHNGAYTASGCDAGYYRYCDAGTYKTAPSGSSAVANGGAGCTNTTLAECTTNYYFDAGTGSDANDCSFATPCATFAKVTSTNGAVGSLSSFSSRTCLYLKGTTDLTTAVTRTPEGGDASTRVGLEVGTAGPSPSAKGLIARYPGSTAKLNFTCDNTNRCASIKVSAANWKIRGLEIIGGYGAALSLRADDIDVLGNYIHNIPGSNSDNQAGVKNLDGADNNYVARNIINNIYDPTKTNSFDDRQNVTLLTFFAGVNNIAEYNIGGADHAVNTVPYAEQNRGARFKHGLSVAASSARSAIRYNVFYNVEKDCVHAVSPKQDLVGNLCVGTNACATVSDGGNAVYHIDDIQIRNNTCLTVARPGGIGFGGGAISFDDPSLLSSNPTTGLTVTGNIINDSATSTAYSDSGTPRSMFSIYRAGTDAQYTAMIPDKFTIGRNCYYNSTQTTLANGFGVFNDNSSTSFGTLVNFDNFKLTPYFFETSPLGYNGNMAFDTDMLPTAVCDNATIGTTIGWKAEWPTIPTPFVPGEKRRGQQNYSGRKGQ